MNQLFQSTQSKTTTPVTPSGFALFELGFRPFYLLAASWSVFVILEWILELNGYGFRPNQVIPGMQWHAHEMVFSFASTVVCGFALTAVQAWTGLATPKGKPLMYLALLWIAGKLGTFIDIRFMLVDFLFLPAIAIVIAKLILERRQYRNLFLPLILTILANLNILFYMAVIGKIHMSADTLLKASLYLILIIEFIIGGRVIPSFTKNAIPGLKQSRNDTLSKLTFGTSIATLLSQLVMESGLIPSIVPATLATIAALLQITMLIGWNAWATRAKPILWILHASYSWVSIGFILLSLYNFGVLTIYPALHAFGIGLTGGLIIGMITRTALGHTARPLIAGKIETSAYALVQIASICWLLSHLPVWELGQLVTVAGVLWIIAFTLYLFKYVPFLMSPRLDGKPG